MEKIVDAFHKDERIERYEKSSMVIVVIRVKLLDGRIDSS